jgi:hypothetical protein
MQNVKTADLRSTGRNGSRRRAAHAEVIDTWRTSCPRLTVWEDAVERGLVAHKNAGPQKARSLW